LVIFSSFECGNNIGERKMTVMNNEPGMKDVKEYIRITGADEFLKDRRGSPKCNAA
jgi:hypothetical protein